VNNKWPDDSKNPDENDYWVVGRNEDEARAEAKKKWPAHEAKDFQLKQDEDVLDTWFSSGLFPFSVFGWPDNTNDLQAFYPTTLLETGHDILFFWVARMVMMGLDLTDRLPFTKVFMHGLVRDKEGKKMSKSRGNVIDPLDVMDSCTLEKLINGVMSGNLDAQEQKRAIDLLKKDFPSGIPECGADALRFGLLSYVSAGSDINLDPVRVVNMRQFCNKIWNASRFGLLNFDAHFKRPDLEVVQSSKASCFHDKWILHRLFACVKTIDDSFKASEFRNAQQAAHAFWYDDLCDRYLEIIKPLLRAKDDPSKREQRIATLNVLFTCFDYGLRLLHPMMPYVTEELYHRLPGSTDAKTQKQHWESITIAPYPKPEQCSIWHDPSLDEHMNNVMAVVSSARSTRANLNLSPSQKVEMFLVCPNNEIHQVLQDRASDIATLSLASRVTAPKRESEIPPGCIGSVVKGIPVTIHIPLKGLVDIEKELVKLDERQDKVQAQLMKLEKDMAVPSYQSKTKAEVKLSHQNTLNALRDELKQLEASKMTFEGIVSKEQLQNIANVKLQRFSNDIAALLSKRTELQKQLDDDAAKPEADRLKEKQRARLEQELRDLEAQWKAKEELRSAFESDLKAKMEKRN